MIRMLCSPERLHSFLPGWRHSPPRCPCLFSAPQATSAGLETEFVNCPHFSLLCHCQPPKLHLSGPSGLLEDFFCRWCCGRVWNGPGNLPLSSLPEVDIWGQASGSLTYTSMVCIYVEMSVRTYVGCVVCGQVCVCMCIRCVHSYSM